jgi:hypothetical protein
MEHLERGSGWSEGKSKANEREAREDESHHHEEEEQRRNESQGWELESATRR